MPSQSSSRHAADRAKELSHLLAILHKWGLHTLGDLAALEPDQLGARLGPLTVRLWEQAIGRATRLLRLVRPAEVFAEQFEFDYEVETAEPLLFVLRRFLEQLTLRLNGLYLLAQEITLGMTFADKSHYEHCFHLPDPTNSVEILFRLLQTHLETFRAEHPIVAVSLTALPSKPARQQFQLFETPLRDPSRLHETLTRLTGLFGRERIGTPVREDSYRSDAFRMETFYWQLPAAPDESEPIPIGPALRRLRLPLAPVVARDAVPGRRHRSTAGVTAPGYNWPATGDSVPGYNAAICARQGPYLASGDWWDEKRWTRAEWDLELENGAVCRCQESADGFVLEGIYD
ncbi:MAG: hypothetical protein M3Q46_05980 [Verrucomicrobiota bacterium]|nr:hypothetical protein [Verrucomicrobiota bacterium]